MIELLNRLQPRGVQSSARQGAIIDYLRAMVLNPGGQIERFHALFLDGDRGFLGDAPLGQSGPSTLTLRLREVFGKALTLDAHGLVIAHNHPSGECRPSVFDIEATTRLNSMARSLDIELLDHLIFTHGAVYSMRAGGQL